MCSHEQRVTHYFALNSGRFLWVNGCLDCGQIDRQRPDETWDISGRVPVPTEDRFIDEKTPNSVVSKFTNTMNFKDWSQDGR